MDDLNLAPTLIARFLEASSKVLAIFVSAEHLPFIAIALLPAVAWSIVVWRFQHESKLLLFLTFIMGIVSVIPIFVLQYELKEIDTLFKSALAASALSIFISSLWVGIYEEIAKNWAMRTVGSRFLRNIDDAIILGMVAGLGFAFIENVFYFYQIAHNPAVSDQFGLYAGMRILLSNTLHVVASGIFGYFYGVAHFATIEYQQELADQKPLIFTKTLHRILHLKNETLFHEEKIMEGLLIAAGIHGLFNGLMGLSTFLSQKGSSLGPVALMLSVPLLVGSLFWLLHLLDEKENRKDLGHLTETPLENTPA